jgi:hypothetical protein
MVGLVLFAIGVADVAAMIYAIAHNQAYSSSFNVFAMVAGFLLWRGGLRTARVVAFFAAAQLSLVAGAPILLALLPRDLVFTYFRITPISTLLPWVVPLVGLLAFALWVYWSLTDVLDTAAANHRFDACSGWLQPRRGFWVGLGVVAIATVGMAAMERTESAAKAVLRARQLRGADYNYFVTNLFVGKTPGVTQVRAVVQAYTDDSIEPLVIEWSEPGSH